MKMFPTLGIKEDNGVLYRLKGFGWEPLGLARDAHAEISDTVRRHRVAGSATAAVALGSPVALAGALLTQQKAYALVTFASGALHSRELRGPGAIHKAAREAAEVNALALVAADDTRDALPAPLTVTEKLQARAEVAQAQNVIVREWITANLPDAGLTDGTSGAKMRRIIRRRYPGGWAEFERDHLQD
jgi:hypothetical protein